MSSLPSLPEEPAPIGRLVAPRGRIFHGLQARSIPGFVRHTTARAIDYAQSEIRRRLDEQESAEHRIIEFDVIRPVTSRSLAVYAHYHPHGVISEMVRRQVEAYCSAGFCVAFVDMSPAHHATARDVLRDKCTVIVRRRSFGRDFGAWKDTIDPLLHYMGSTEELLLVNDSVLGPVRPLEPVFDALRRGGNGAFGLTENIGGGAHLQSYFLVFRGTEAIACVRDFLADLLLTTSKWRIIQDGEIGLSRHLRARNVPVKALFPYDAVLQAALHNPDVRTHLVKLFKFAGIFSTEEVSARLVSRTPNPTHFFWRTLLDLGHPFIKTDLFVGSGATVRGATDWREAVRSQARIIEEHLASRTA